MIDDPTLDALLAAAPALTGIPARWWDDSVRAHLGISLRFAATLLDPPLPDDTDPAPVFRA